MCVSTEPSQCSLLHAGGVCFEMLQRLANTTHAITEDEGGEL